MKLITIIITLIILAPLSSYAQKHQLGIEGGLYFSNLRNEFKVPDRKHREGITLGVTYDYTMLKYLQLSTGVFYEQRGYKDFLPMGYTLNESYTLSSRYHFDYLSLPVKLKGIIGNKFYGYGSAGIVPAYLTKAGYSSSLIKNGIETDNNISFDRKEEVTRYDIGGLAEIGAGYNISKKIAINTIIRYQQSFTKLALKDNPSLFYTRHNGAIISVGLKYALK